MVAVTEPIELRTLTRFDVARRITIGIVYSADSACRCYEAMHAARAGDGLDPA
jgi:hypothetical protein